MLSVNQPTRRETAHKEMHPLGITRARYGSQTEALARCSGMQLSIVAAVQLGVPTPMPTGSPGST